MRLPVTAVPRVMVTYSRTRLYLAALAGNLLYVSVGCVMAWTSPTVPLLKKEGRVTDEQASWLGSLYCVGAAMGPALTSFSLDSIGRKATLLITMTIFMASYLVLAVTQSIVVMYFGRILGGIGVGATFSSVSVYLSEISDNEVRGAIGSVNQMFVGIGLLVQYAVGPYVSYIALLSVSCSMAVVFGLAFITMPESPYHLMNTNRREAAVQALCWLRGNARPPQVQRELEIIQETLEEFQKNAGHKVDLFTKKAPRRALGISLWAMLCQQITGINVVLSFTQTIFAMATKNISSEMSSMLVGGVNIVSSCFAPPLVRRFGLKYVLIGAGFGMALCQMLLSTFFYLKTTGNADQISWLPVFSILLFNICFCVGPGPLPWTSVAELFPCNLKGFASCIIGVYVWLIAFAVMKNYSTFVSLAGPYPVFLFFGLAELIGVIAMVFIHPNTRNLSFQEIQELLTGEHPPDTDSVDDFK